MKTWALGILFILMIWCAIAQDAKAAAPLNLQTCIITPTTGGVAGCPFADVLLAPVGPTSLVRSTVNNAQGWRPFSSLHALDQVYAADGAWHVLGTITPALQPSTPLPPPVVTTPPMCPPPVPPKDTWVAMQWSCSVANKVATCTAPLSP